MKISTSGYTLVGGAVSAPLLSSAAASTSMSSRSLASCSSAALGGVGGITGARVAAGPANERREEKRRGKKREVGRYGEEVSSPHPAVRECYTRRNMHGRGYPYLRAP